MVRHQEHHATPWLRSPLYHRPICWGFVRMIIVGHGPERLFGLPSLFSLIVPDQAGTCHVKVLLRIVVMGGYPRQELGDEHSIDSSCIEAFQRLEECFRLSGLVPEMFPVQAGPEESSQNGEFVNPIALRAPRCPCPIFAMPSTCSVLWLRE